MPKCSVSFINDTSVVRYCCAALCCCQRKFPLLLLFSVVLVSRSFSQCDSLFFRYGGTAINSVSLIDSNIILAAGDNGYVIKSIDGGKRWKNMRTFSSYPLVSLMMVTGTTGYAIGGNKTVLKTEDQGENWFPLNSGLQENNLYSTASFTDACFIDKERGFITGDQGLLLSTTDGGRSWKDTSFGQFDRLTSIAFLNDSTGFICSYSNSLYKTTNAGRSWQNIPHGSTNYNYAFRKIKFIDAATGFILGSGGNCLKTNDAGTTWTTVKLPTSENANDVCFISPIRGFIVADRGMLLVTDDGGTTWHLPLNSLSSSLTCIGKDLAGKRLVIAGNGGFYRINAYGGRTLLSSTDSGTTFTPQSRNPDIKYNDVFFLNDSTGYIAGESGYAMKTSDYGESWQPLQNVPSVLSGNAVKKIFFIDVLHGYAGSDNIYKTSDGGLSWVKTATPGQGTQYSPIQLYFFDTLTGLVQDEGSIYKTINGGDSWQLVAQSPLANFFMSFAATANGRVYAVGNNGKAIVSTDRGSTWNAANLSTSKFLTSVYFYDNNTGFIGTGDTTIFKTTDGGNKWMQINTGISWLQVNDLHFTDPANGYMLCSRDHNISFMYKTADGGLSWRFERQESENLPRMAGFSTLYTVGGNGLILKTDTRKRPPMPGYIYGRDSTCVNMSYLYTTGNMTGVSYNWSVSGGGISHSLANNDSIAWNNPGTYTISLSVSNACGTSATRNFTSTAAVFAPTISVKDSVLTAPEAVSYQWLRGGGYVPPIQGGNARTIVPTISGSYSVIVQSNYGCSATTPAISFAVDRKRLLCPGDSTLLSSSQFASTYQWQRNNGSGFVDLSDDSAYTGTHSSVLHIRNIPSAWYGYTYKCITNFGIGDTFTLQFVNNWTGIASDSWEDPANWSCGHLPDANTDVVIKNGAVVIHSDVTIRTLQLNPTTQLTVQSGYHLTIGH